VSRLLRVDGDQVVIDTTLCRAVIFDMDGVVTDSVPVHRRAWQETFDAFLDEIGSDAARFSESDYLTHVDGKPRYDGVRDFLTSRGIDLPEGSPEDPPEAMTVCGVGNRKNERFLELLAQGGVEAYQSTLDLIEQLEQAGAGIALITSSRNAGAVLASAGVDQAHFDAIVDGNESARLGLPGKPDPAIFHEAARRLEVSPEMAVVVEDAMAGVAAGRSGGFGVIGIDRGENRLALLAEGADVVVADLSRVGLGARLADR
jgi:alpha,alpha-trehalase